MIVLISYDISDSNQEVKQDMTDIGYIDAFTSQRGRRRYVLPESTLLHLDRISPDTAIDDLENIINHLNRTRNQNELIVLEKCIAVESISWSAIPR